MVQAALKTFQHLEYEEGAHMMTTKEDGDHGDECDYDKGGENGDDQIPHVRRENTT